MADDDDQVTAWEERLQELPHDHVRRRLLEQQWPVFPEGRPRCDQTLGIVGRGERRLAREMRGRRQGEAAHAAVLSDARIDVLEVLTLILAHPGAGQPTDLRM